MKKLLPLLLLMVLFVSCSSDDDSDNESKYYGMWILQESTITYPARYDASTQSIVGEEGAETNESQIGAFYDSYGIDIASFANAGIYSYVSPTRYDYSYKITEYNNMKVALIKGYDYYPIIFYTKLNGDQLTVYSCYTAATSVDKIDITRLKRWTVAHYTGGVIQYE